MEQTERSAADIGASEEKTSFAPTHRVRRALKIGCLATLLGMCSCSGALLVALQNGPVVVGLPGGPTLRIGSDDFVLSNYSFREGTTYYVDLEMGGARNILEFRRIEDSGKLELVVHHADRNTQGETRLLTLDVP